VDFVRYADGAAALVNAPLDDLDDVRELLSDRPWLHPMLTERDPPALRRIQRDLRPVFAASSAGEAGEVVELLNALLGRHPVTPRIVGHDAQSWHLHVADRRSGVAELLTAECLLGLAILVCDAGATRLGVCQASSCTNVFVDTSPNQSRRYCSDRCSSRANVAAYRARRKAEAR